MAAVCGPSGLATERLEVSRPLFHSSDEIRCRHGDGLRLFTDVQTDFRFGGKNGAEISITDALKRGDRSRDHASESFRPLSRRPDTWQVRKEHAANRCEERVLCPNRCGGIIRVSIESKFDAHGEILSMSGYALTTTSAASTTSIISNPACVLPSHAPSGCRTADT